MSKCPGLHCPGCGDGDGAVVLYGGGAVVVAILAVEWIASHAWELLAVTAACGTLAVAAVVWLIRRQERREAVAAVERPYLIERDVPPAVDPAGHRAIGPSVINLNFYGVPATQRAEIIRSAIERNPS